MRIGTARYCIAESVAYARERHTFGKPLAGNQAIQFRLAELHADYELVKALTFQVAGEMDQMSKREVAERLSDKVAICNYRANKLACEAADAAIQVHGAMGFTYEHRLHHYTKRLWSWRDDFGTEVYWNTLLGRKALEVGGDGLWPFLTRLGSSAAA